jgi:DNA-binding transcriptional regulator GbsR (MarR family)
MSAPSVPVDASREGVAPWQAAFLEQSGALVELTGLPPSFVAVFAWLIVCDPPEQSVVQLRVALSLSSGAISAATATLIRMGLVERVTQPGRRAFSYRLHPGGWDRLWRVRLEGIVRMRAVTAAALAEAPGPQPRLRELHEMYAWFEDRIGELLADPVHTGGDPGAR